MQLEYDGKWLAEPAVPQLLVFNVVKAGFLHGCRALPSRAMYTCTDFGPLLIMSPLNTKMSFSLLYWHFRSKIPNSSTQP